MSERIKFNHPVIQNYEHHGTIVRTEWHSYILWDDSQKWEYLDSFLHAADANNWQYEIIVYS